MDDKYDLMLRDEHPDYKLFYCFPGTAAKNAATAVIERYYIFGVPEMLMSDGPTHFRVDHFATSQKASKHCITSCAFTPSGAMEQLNT